MNNVTETIHEVSYWAQIAERVSASKLGLASIACSAIAGALLFPFFFNGFGGFVDCVKFTLMPDLLLDFRSDWPEGMNARARIFFWFFIAIGAGTLAYLLLPNWLPGSFAG